MLTRKSLTERFWPKVRVRLGGCWLWSGAVTRTYAKTPYQGEYGRIRAWVDGHWTHRLAHVVAYELMRGPVPDGFQLDHLCRQPRCVNPWHLEPVTQLENIMRGGTMVAQNARKILCKRGHPLSGPNLYVYRTGKRSCRACMRWHAARYREAV